MSYTPKSHPPYRVKSEAQRLLLTAARAKLAAPGAHITTGSFAEDSCGIPVDPNHPEACCFCVVGAVLHVLDQPDASSGIAIPFLHLLNAAVETICDDDRVSITKFNDDDLDISQYPEPLRAMTPQQRAVYVLDMILDLENSNVSA